MAVKETAVSAAGAQTLLRGLDLLHAVAAGVHDLENLAVHTGLRRSTAHRLLAALVRQGYLRHQARQGYFLGPRLIELGFKAHGQLHLPSIARPHLEWLRNQTREAAHLAVLQGTEVVYIDKVPGTRELQMSSYLGARLPVQSTALGKALLSGLSEAEWDCHFVPGLRRTANTISDLVTFRQAIAEAARQGYALDLEENDAGIRCVAAPIRDGSGQVVAAISVTSASIYVDQEAIAMLIPLVKEAARRISQELGWNHA